jgi:hypothetical protein
MVRAALAAALCALAALVPAVAQAAPAAPVRAQDGHMSLARFGSGRGIGRSRGFGRSRRFGTRRRSHHVLRRIVRALAIGYLLHLLFTTPGGLIVLIFMVVLFMLAVRRIRTRRFGY